MQGILEAKKLKNLLTLGRTLPLRMERALASKLVPYLSPAQDDFSKIAQKQRSFLARHSEAKSLEPTEILLRQPFHRVLHCAISFDKFLFAAIEVGLEDCTFQDLQKNIQNGGYSGFDRDVISRWCGGLRLCNVPALESYFQRKYGKRKLDLFKSPGESELLKSGFIAYQDYTPFLTNKGASTPLLRYSRRARKVYLPGGEHWCYEIAIPDRKKYLRLSYKYGEKRWHLFKMAKIFNEFEATRKGEARS